MRCPCCRARLALVEMPADPGGAAVEEVRLAKADPRVDPDDPVAVPRRPTPRPMTVFPPRERRSSDPALIARLAEARRNLDAIADQFLKDEEGDE